MGNHLSGFELLQNNWQYNVQYHIESRVYGSEDGGSVRKDKGNTAMMEDYNSDERTTTVMRGLQQG